MAPCEGCGRAWAKLRDGYPGAAAAEAARVLWWKARRGHADDTKQAVGGTRASTIVVDEIGIDADGRS